MNPTNALPCSTQELPAVNSPTVSSRCAHRFSNGKRCRLPGLESQSGLCPNHFRLSQAGVSPSSSADSSDLSPELLPELLESSSAVDLRKFLSRLLVLVAQGRISSRRAAVLSYITNQL